MQFSYRKWISTDAAASGSPFEQLLDLFRRLLEFTAGDAGEALQWLTALDREHNMTGDDYGIGDFIEDLRKNGYLEDNEAGEQVITSRMERTLREKSLEEIFTQLRKGNAGNHKTPFVGRGDERQPETRPWEFGDDPSRIDMTGTLSNAFRRGGFSDWKLRQDDVEVHETDHQTSSSTVVMIDLSHSMVLYGEDRITPARKTAMALSELILTRYPKDTLDIVAFGNEAWEVEVKDIPYLQVGPFHTNTRAGLERSRNILRRRKNPNKQIFLITDGKPSCHFEYGRLYKNSFGLDRRIINRVLDEAVMCRREKITITTFMIARDPYLQQFVRTMTEANHGRAYFSSLDDLGSFIFEDFIRNRRRNVR